MPQLGVRRSRRAENRAFRLRKPVWIDPYPQIPGTEPEKRLFEALMLRGGLYFIFQGDIPGLSTDYRTRITAEFKKASEAYKKVLAELSKTAASRKLRADELARLRRREKLLKEQYRLRGLMNELRRKDKAGIFLFEPAFKPDFVFPEYKVIIDPFGIYHHSLPAAVKRDQVKSVVYRSLGYAFYHPWWDQRGFLWAEGTGSFLHYDRVGYDAMDILDRIKEFKHGPRAKLEDPKDIAAKKFPGYRLGKNLGAGANSVAIANKKRTRPKNLTIRVRGRRRRPVRR